MPTTLLNDDGTASMATLLMSSHHAFRRDFACLAAALAAGTAPHALVAAEWTNLRNSLHGHHHMEDSAIFPSTRDEHPETAAPLAELEAQHRLIDPLLERGDAHFANLADVTHRRGAREVIAAITDLLTVHLDLEERTIVPHLRASKDFPPPPDEAMLAMYAEGFAWSTAGLAPAVREQIFALLPPALRERIPAARTAFDERCRRVWGHTHADISMTSIPTA
jgi:hypothetical protein